MDPVTPSLTRGGGNGALLEHVNLNVPNRAAAHAFYVGALGVAVHPLGTRRHQLHVNLGVSQVHAPFADTPPDGVGEAVRDLEGGSDSLREARVEDGSPYVGEAQVLAGVVRLWVRSASRSLARLRAARAQPALAGTQFAFAKDESARAGELGCPGPVVRVTCPWGNAFELVEAPEDVREALEPSAIGAHPGGGGDECLALAGLELPVRPGVARKLAAMYGEVFGMEVFEAAGLESAQAAAWSVVVGPYQRLTFVESADAPDPREYWTSRRTRGWHLCVYVRGWAEARERATAAGVAKPSDRFAALDAPLEPVQFRCTDLRAPGGELLLSLEHEVRSLQTRMCPLLEGMEGRRADV